MNLGEFNLLQVSEFTDHGAYLVDSADNKVLLPSKFVPEEIQLDETIEVFLYTDSEDRIVATTQTPKLRLGEIACLEVVGTSQYGAFLDWGLDKDLFLPFKNQREKIKGGEKCFVTMYVDDFSDRLVATEKIGYMFQIAPDLHLNTPYKAVVYDQIGVGYKIYVEGPCRGILYKNEVKQELFIGDEVEVYLKNVRPDGKYDFKVINGGVESIESIADSIISYLAENSGVSEITDKSDPEEIAQAFGVSKKMFKKAVGNLYRKRKVILKDGKMILS